MNIHIKRPLHARELSLSPGNYQINIDEDNNQVVLSNATGMFRLGATKRSRKTRVTRPSAHLRQVVGEPRWLLLVQVPPAHEWVVSLSEVL